MIWVGVFMIGFLGGQVELQKREQRDEMRGEVALFLPQAPFSKGALAISLPQETSFENLDSHQLEEIWKVRRVGEEFLRRKGEVDILSYGKIEKGKVSHWQLVPYPHLPPKWDVYLLRKVASLMKQITVLCRTFWTPSFASLGEKLPLSFLEETPSPLPKTGKGALIQAEVIQRQRIHPLPEEGKPQMSLFYNYAPIRTGGEELHFLVVPHPTSPARNFSELEKEQYVQVLALTQKVWKWAEAHFGEQITLYCFDKTGERAGQTQPVFHSHLVIVSENKGELVGRLSLLLRMLLPSFPLEERELNRRVHHYRESLGGFLQSFEKEKG